MDTILIDLFVEYGESLLLYHFHFFSTLHFLNCLLKSLSCFCSPFSLLSLLLGAGKGGNEQLSGAWLLAGVNPMEFPTLLVHVISNFQIHTSDGIFFYLYTANIGNYYSWKVDVCFIILDSGLHNLSSLPPYLECGSHKVQTFSWYPEQWSV